MHLYLNGGLVPAVLKGAARRLAKRELEKSIEKGDKRVAMLKGLSDADRAVFQKQTGWWTYERETTNHAKLPVSMAAIKGEVEPWRLSARDDRREDMGSPAGKAAAQGGAAARQRPRTAAIVLLLKSRSS